MDIEEAIKIIKGEIALWHIVERLTDIHSDKTEALETILEYMNNIKTEV